MEADTALLKTSSGISDKQKHTKPWRPNSRRSDTRVFPHLRAVMVFLLICLTVLHLVTLAMLLIATLEKSWWVWADSEITDLWYNCFHDNDTKTWLCATARESDWLQSVQALMVLSVVFSSISFLVFLGQLLTMSRGQLFYFTGLCQAFADFAACLIFTFHRKEILNDSRDLSKGHFGYCFILAWLCVPLLLVSAVLYVHLRKKHMSLGSRLQRSTKCCQD
ncbi:hypothetical protein INR49_029753 [Caranx melampygus]|nr:hypothetical protein INR49_029753 [Caranx melampygus]